MSDLPVYSIPPETVRLLGGEYRTLAASLYWVQAIFAFGDALYFSKGMEELEDLVHGVTVLDPEWSYPFEFAGLLLDGSRGTDAAGGIALLRRGIGLHPTNWRLRIYLAMRLHSGGGSPEEISEVLLPLTRSGSEAPDYARLLAFTFLAKEGHASKAMDLLVQSIRTSSDPLLRDQLKAKLDELLRKSHVDLGEHRDPFLAGILAMLQGNSTTAEQARQLLLRLVDDRSPQGWKGETIRDVATAYEEQQARRGG